jgi:hypothetical protein
MFTVVSQSPIAKAVDLFIFTSAPDARSYNSIASCRSLTFREVERNTVTSSAYAIAAAFAARCPIVTPGTVDANLHRNGLNTSANRAMLRGQPWRTLHRIGIADDKSPFTAIEAFASRYRFRIRCWNHLSKPYRSSNTNMYWCNTLSKAALESRDKIHITWRWVSACAITSRIVETASRMVVPLFPQCWLGCRMSGSHMFSLRAMIRASSLTSAFNS